MAQPCLIEPGVSYFFSKTLQNCHVKKMQYYNKLYNLFLFALFFIILGVVLYYKYKGKLTPKERKYKEQKERIYIMNKIKSLDIEKQKKNQQIITNLPSFNNEYNYLNQKYQ